MATYYHHTFKCPHCGRVVETATTMGKPIKKGDIAKFGCPINICPNCRNYYIDGNCRERACLSGYGLKSTDTWVITKDAIFFSIFSLVCVVIFFFAVGESASPLLMYLKYVVFLIPVIILLISAGGRNKRIDKIDHEIAESIARLSIREYALLLKESHFSVPRKYIEPTESDKKTLKAEQEKYFVTPERILIEKTKLDNKLFIFSPAVSEEFSDGWNCPICGKRNSKKTRICRSCKYNIMPDAWECPICGKFNSDMVSICECGYEDF